ncbi:VanZ family protein [uncultured Winogradskyella sp.]|uniref:VanZ family protein n=1 Tax=uncultured Winogradskyella sp. TaxID=395353 RepID=UPI0030EDCEA7|tara:strand:- start:820 stop:1221 length:402 start_codon:yes stop_codon:yes gene_type:complete
MSNWIKGITALFLLFIIWIIFSADTGGKNVFFDFVNRLPYGDKIGHFFLFGFFTLAVNSALRFKNFKYWEVLPLGTLLVAICVLIEELSQAFFPNRTLDISDLIADGLGILFFTFIGNLLNKKGVFKLKESSK